MANDKAFKVKNDLIAARYLGNTGTTTASEEGYRITNSQFEVLSDDFNTLASETLVSDITFKDDGTKAFIIGNSEDRVAAVDLSTAWDISTASTSTEFSPVITFDTSPLGLTFKSDGSKMYVAGNSGDAIYQYDLTTDWDVSSASHVSANDLDVSGETTAPASMQFKPDGLTMFVLGSNNIFEYTLTSAWDLGTASYSTNTTGDLVSVSGNIRGFEFNADGTSCFVVDTTTEVITEYSVSPAWDVTGFTDTGNTYDISGQTTSALAIAFGQSGKKMYVPTNDSDKVRQYTSFMPKTDLDLSTGNTFATSTVGNHEITFSNPPASGKAIGFTLELNNGEGFDISSATANGTTLNVSAQDSGNMAIFFKPDGTKFYHTGNTSTEDVHEYDLTTKFDLNSATYVRSKQISSEEISPYGLFFKPDGSKMYISGSGSDQVREYNLTTNWDISTASLSQSFTLESAELQPFGMFISPDGYQFYFTGNTGDNVRQYTTTTAWSVQNLSYTRLVDVSSQETTPTDIHFNSDGSAMFIAGTGSSTKKVNEYSLSTPYNISSVTHVRTFNTGSNPSEFITFTPDGTKMILGGNSTGLYYEYTTTETGSITWPTAVEWHGGAAPTTDIGKEIYAFFTKDGGTTYYGKRAGSKFA